MYPSPIPQECFPFPMFPKHVPQCLCSTVPMLPKRVPRYLCFPVPMFIQLVHQSLCSPVLFHRSVFHSLCSPNMFPSAYVLQTCSPVPMFPQLVHQFLCSPVRIFSDHSYYVYILNKYYLCNNVFVCAFSWRLDRVRFEFGVVPVWGELLTYLS